MKKVFVFCKIFAIFLLLNFLFSSCGNTRVITITGGDPNWGKLTMVDEMNNPADTVYVNPDQKVKWKIHHHTHIYVDSIPLKSQSGALLESRPHQKFLSKSCVGTVKDEQNLKAAGTVFEDYKIVWHFKNEPTHTYDPRIQLNPKTN